MGAGASSASPRWRGRGPTATTPRPPPGGAKALLQRAGLPEIRFHDLRHTCATLLLSKNVNPKIVSEMLGHASIAITLDTYSHVLPNMRDQAAAAMENALS